MEYHFLLSFFPVLTFFAKYFTLIWTLFSLLEKVHNFFLLSVPVTVIKLLTEIILFYPVDAKNERQPLRYKDHCFFVASKFLRKLRVYTLFLF